MKGKILVVDDEQGMRRLLSEVLAAEYQVVLAENGGALQKCFGQEQPDVILLDVRLGDANGLDLLPQIKKRWPETEVIILTGAPDDNEAVSWAVEATKRGAFNFVRKGERFDIEKLVADVTNAVE
ncbi:MAG TPA: response regulator, partial [Candidatus Binatia bacterium]|nr:response regulator [Candidatus Binatia bacterium]